MSYVRKSVHLSALLMFGAMSAMAATPPTSATDPQQGVVNARIHATVASKVDTIDAVHLHLHHVINCLEGPHGTLYSAKAEAQSAYHCNDVGEKGAVDDPQAGSQARKLAQQAVREAVAGIHATTVNAGHHDAADVIRTLDAVQRAWPRKS